MALSEKSRHAIYQHLSPTLGEEATAEMLSYFPARDVEEPATKQHLDVLRADLFVEMAALRTDIEQRFNRMTFWLAGSVFSAAGLVVAAVRLGG